MHCYRRYKDLGTSRKEGGMIYLKLFISFLKIGAFSFGGGYAAMPLIESEVVNTNHWLSTAEFGDLITISQMTPGPIAINSATFVGIRIAGVFGAMAATLGCILPALILVTVIAWLYMKYKKMSMLQSVLAVLRPAVVAMIAISGVKILMQAFGLDMMTIKSIRLHMIVIFCVCMVLLIKYNKNPISVMVFAGVLNLLYNVLTD